MSEAVVADAGPLMVLAKLNLLHLLISDRGIGPETGHAVRFPSIQHTQYTFLGIHGALPIAIVLPAGIISGRLI